MKVLIAEDDLTSRLMLTALLKTWGYDPDVTENGAEAWQRIQQPDAPGILILDWNMPGMDGIEIIRRTRALDLLEPPYIIILTVRGNKGDIVEGLEAGANDYISKPYDHEELRARVEVGRRMMAMQATVAEQKEALRESGEQYRTLVRNLGSGLVVHGPDTSILFSNPMASELLGLSEDQMRGKLALDPAWCFLHEDGTPAPVEQYPVNRVLSTGETIKSQVIGIRRPDRTEPIWLLFNAYPVRDANARILQVVVTFHDITERKRVDEALRESEGRFRNLLQNVPFVAVQGYSPDGTTQYWNQASEQLYGYCAQEAIGRNLLDLIIPPEMRNDVEGAMRQMAETGQPIPAMELSLMRKDGSRISVFSSHTIVKVPERPQELFCIDIDLTELKRAEEALQVNEARHAKMVANIGDVIAIIDRDGINRYKSPNIERWFGWLPEELVGFSAWDNVHPEDLGSAQQFIGMLLGEPNATGTTECRYRCKDGQYKWIEFTGVNLLHDPDIRGILGNYHDITERKRAEEELAQEQLFMQTLLGGLPGIFYLYTYPELHLVRWNQNHETNLGFSPEEMKGRSIFEWHLPGEKEKVIQAVDVVMEKGQNMIESTLLTKDGRLVPFIMTGVKVAVPGQTYLMGVGLDISERKRAEQEHAKLQAQLLQAQKMESVGRLAGGVAHDFNNMLGVIMGHADMALEQIDSEAPLHDDLKEIQKAALRSANLTRQLLAFARKQTISPKVLDLNDTVASMLKMLQRLIGEDIELAWQPGPELWPVKMDPSQVDQMLANLAVNARDAIAGVGHLTIQTENVVFDESYCRMHDGCVAGDYVLLAVSDTGAGMDKETLEHVFEPFFTTKEVGKGTGLGLAMVYGAVKQNRGFINVYSEPGQGTTFKIYMPRDESVRAAGTAARKKVVHGTETVLLTEDEESILTLGTAILKKHGYTVLAARTPAEALALAERHEGPIHLLITDVVMPGMNGKGLKDRLIALRPKIKVLFMSGYTSDIIAHQGVIEEGVEFLQKPFSVNTLAQKVREVLHSQSPR